MRGPLCARLRQPCAVVFRRRCCCCCRCRCRWLSPQLIAGLAAAACSSPDASGEQISASCACVTDRPTVLQLDLACRVAAQLCRGPASLAAPQRAGVMSVRPAGSHQWVCSAVCQAVMMSDRHVMCAASSRRTARWPFSCPVVRAPTLASVGAAALSNRLRGHSLSSQRSVVSSRADRFASTSRSACRARSKSQGQRCRSKDSSDGQCLHPV